MVGSYALGRETYGVVASVLAIAVIVFGPVSQYLSQNLLRVLCTAQQADRPLGAALLFSTGCIGLIELGRLAGAITTSEAFQLCTLIVALLLLRICEVKLISEEKIVSSIAVYYAGPPVFCSAFYVVAASLGGGHAAAAAAQSLGYCVAALFAMFTAKGVGSLLAQGLRSPAVSAVREFTASVPLMISGGATAAAEFLPVVLLRGMNAFAVIPVFEIARKLASIPTTLVNPLLNQVNPSMIRAYAAKDQPAIRALLRRMFRFLLYTGIVFVCGVAAMLVASLYEPQLQEVCALLIPLSVGSVAAMWCLPYQSLLIAVRGDHWFAISSGVAVVLLLVLTQLFSALGPGLAVACAVGLSVATSGLIVRYRAIRET
jgi:O-antigen/teichoic acid export membrane protein